ncbi:MAG: DUF169 domain-containing protein [Oscillospiraceae bacterium]|nr:DUF169 domain-containing protein [Oscillospiraceae bacterium]
MGDKRKQNAEHSSVLHSTLGGLQTEPIAVKLIENESEIPDGAVRPFRDYGTHMAMCQAFALVRRERRTIYCDREGEWCWAPLVAFGLCESDEGTEAFDILTSVVGVRDKDAAAKFFANFPRLPYGKYAGVLLAPLSDCGFEPDVTLIYFDNNSQLRGAALAVKSRTGSLISTQLDAIDSCAYACVATINSGEYRVTIPDIGEHERAMAGENEIILSVPHGKLAELTESLSVLDSSGMGFANWKRVMTYDFQRPKFYDDVFRTWGL